MYMKSTLAVKGTLRFAKKSPLFELQQAISGIAFPVSPVADMYDWKSVDLSLFYDSRFVFLP